MDIVLTLLEQWGLYLLAGVIVVYFGWHGLAFLQAQPLTFRNDPILTTTTLGWGGIWLVGNGMGNALFIFGVVSVVEEIAGYRTAGFTFPLVLGSETLVFLLGLMPSLYQFRYQADPGYLETLTFTRRAVAITLTLADSVFCALGWYWWLLPPVLTEGHLDFPFDQTLLVGTFAWSIFASYIAQYMAHMQLYDLLGLEPPALPNPFAALWHDVVARFTHGDAATHHDQDPVRLTHPKASRPRRKSATRTPAHAPYPPGDEASGGMTFDEWEPQS